MEHSETADFKVRRFHTAICAKAKIAERKVKFETVFRKSKEFSAKLAGKLKLNEYKRAGLEADLKTAGMDVTPEEYTADAIVKAAAFGLLAIPAFFIVKVSGLQRIAYKISPRSAWSEG